LQSQPKNKKVSLCGLTFFVRPISSIGTVKRTLNSIPGEVCMPRRSVGAVLLDKLIVDTEKQEWGNPLSNEKSFMFLAYRLERQRSNDGCGSRSQE
jgi:hypothetical protein